MEGILTILIIVWVISRLVSKTRAPKGKKPAAKRAVSASAPQKIPSVELHRPAPVMNRPAHRDFSAPEAPCIVCEQTGDDHFQRDKARRLAQLDDWLKIGLIDRDEYRVLKDRYQRGI